MVFARRIKVTSLGTKGNLMRFKTCLVLIVTSLVLTLSQGIAVAQNRYLASDSHGVTFLAGLARADDATGYGGMATLTVFDRFNFGLGYLAAQ